MKDKEKKLVIDSREGEDLSLWQFNALKGEIIPLEPDYYLQAREIINQVSPERKWQVYLNVLALLSFEEWLKERAGELKVEHQECALFKQPPQPSKNAIYNLKVGEFKFCLLTTESLIDKVITVPKIAIEKQDFLAHFYVVIEVWEEEEQASIQGFLRYHQLLKYCHQLNRESPGKEFYPLPLSVFDIQVNNLLLFCFYLKPKDIPLSRVSGDTQTEKLTLVKLSQWLQGAFEEGWQTVEVLLGRQELEPLSSFRSERTDNFGDNELKRGRIIDLGMRVQGNLLALVITLVPEKVEQTNICVRLYPHETKILPPGLELSILDELGNRVLDESGKPLTVAAREADNWIQLKLYGSPGEGFQIKIALGKFSVTQECII